MDTRLRSNAAAGPFSSQPSGLRVFWLAALSLIGRRPQRVFSLFASRIQAKYAAAPLNQSRTWCTSTDSFMIGGWTLSVHHAYDATTNTLFLGEGRQRNGYRLGTPVSFNGNNLLTSATSTYCGESNAVIKRTRIGTSVGFTHWILSGIRGGFSNGDLSVKSGIMRSSASLNPFSLNPLPE